MRNAYTGGAAMGPDHFRFFHALGVNLKQIYGQTEIAGISVVHRRGDIKFDTVGTPIPGTEVRSTEDGEIISKSPSVFLGYYKNPEATAKTLKDGWLYSGDKGFIDEDGHLVVFDRTKDVMILNDGRLFAPQYLETRLKFSPFIKDAWVIGDERTLHHRRNLHRLCGGRQMGRREASSITPVTTNSPKSRRSTIWWKNRSARPTGSCRNGQDPQVRQPL